MVASASFEPEVARFIEDITTSGYDAQQYLISSDSFAEGITVSRFQKKMRSIEGPLLVALGKYEPKEEEKKGSPKNWELITNPSPKVKIEENDVIVTFGSAEESEKLSRALKAGQGR